MIDMMFIISPHGPLSRVGGLETPLKLRAVLNFECCGRRDNGGATKNASTGYFMQLSGTST